MTTILSDEAAASRWQFTGWKRALGFVLLLAFTIMFIIPILWMVTMSFQAGDKMFQLGTEWIPSVWHPEHYPNALSRAAFASYFLNSGPVSSAVRAGHLPFCTHEEYRLVNCRRRIF